MDGQRFDRITRSLATSTSRRDAIKALLGLTGAAAGAIVADPAASARTTGSRPRVPVPPPPQTCVTGETLCAGTCCPAGQTCCNGACCAESCTNGTCCPSGAVECAGGCCESGDVCCGSICCHDAAHCSPQGNHCCPPATEVCGEDCCGAGQTCCGGECCDGYCYGEERCCPTGRTFCEATGVCCEAGQPCCGANGCCSGVCVGSGQVCCPVAGGEVCADTCCDTATQKCCTGSDSSLSCIALGDCCPAPGVCCVNNARGEVCSDSCCDTTTEKCCEAIDGSLSCIAINSCCPGAGGCCSETDCAAEGVCAGTCNLTTNSCEYPDETVPCGDTACSSDNRAALSFACDGAGGCKTLSEPCAPYLCEDAECPISCSEGADCLGGVCNDDNLCCPPEDSCFEEYCCPSDPDHPGVGCCPAGDGCCECFIDRQGPFCCEGTQFELCPSASGDWTQDFCIDTARYRCVANTIQTHEYVCDNDVICTSPCCGGATANAGPGGTCCEAGTECSNGVCVSTNRMCSTLKLDGSVVGCNPGEGCTTSTECGVDEACSSRGQCCPGHRASSIPTEGAPWGDVGVTCCSADEEGQPSCDGNPFCRGVPDTSCTSIYSFSR